MEKIILLVLAVMLSSTVDAADWTYTPGPYGPKNWTKVAAICGGQRQSPIDIDTSETESKSGLALEFSRSYTEAPPAGSEFMLTNNGHSMGAVVKLPANNNYSLYVNNIKYVPYQFHFHWGHNNSVGSEHHIDRKAYPLEVHFIHRNTKYNSVGAALNHHDGLAVIGTFFEISATDNPVLTKLTRHFSKITTSGTNTTIPAFKFSEVFPSAMLPFYHYLGSLTTPNCQEAVHWYVTKNVLKVSAAQMNAFRSLRNTGGGQNYAIVENYRPPQPLNGRKVYLVGGASGLTGSTVTLAVLASAVTMLSTLL